jgi:dephospho-CoA kinase
MLLSGLHPNPFTFGEQELSERMFQEQRLIAVFVILPLAIVVGHLSLRMSSRPPSSILRADFWNTTVRLILADFCVELLQKSLSCVPFEDYEDNVYELVVQSLGKGCPLYARALNPQATVVVFSMRFLALAIGVYLGEGWMPVAITGGVATGKSTVVALLMQEDKECVQDTKEEELDNDTNAKDGDNNIRNGEKETGIEPLRETVHGGGVFLVDTDKIGHAIVLESTAGNVHSKLVAAFGDEILGEDGVIDRKKMGAIVFQNETLRRKLNRIMHPPIITKMLQKIGWGLYASGADMTLVEVPLLFESGFLTRAIFALTICVTCTPEQELERLMARNPELSQDDCERRIGSQMPLSTKASMADIVISNHGDMESLTVEVEKAREQIMWRLYGFGLTLFQIITIMGIALPVAMYYKLYQHQVATSD